MDKKTMEQVINGMADKIDKLEDKLTALETNKYKINSIPYLCDRIDKLSFGLGKLERDKRSVRNILSDRVEKLLDNNHNTLKGLNDKIDDLDRLLINKNMSVEGRIEYLEKVDKSYKSDVDDLEAKNYQLRRELDGIYKVLEMDACDIQALQDKVLNGYTREQNKMEGK